MNAGREMDALIAKQVMGIRLLTEEEMRIEAERVWQTQPSCRFFMKGFSGFPATAEKPAEFQQDLPRYSTDIADAWKVIERFDTCELQRWRQTHRTDLPEFFWSVSLTRYTPEQYVPPTDGATVAEAICRAALAAVKASA